MPPKQSSTATPPQITYYSSNHYQNDATVIQQGSIGLKSIDTFLENIAKLQATLSTKEPYLDNLIDFDNEINILGMLLSENSLNIFLDNQQSNNLDYLDKLFSSCLLPAECSLRLMKKQKTLKDNTIDYNQITLINQINEQITQTMSKISSYHQEITNIFTQQPKKIKKKAEIDNMMNFNNNISNFCNNSTTDLKDSDNQNEDNQVVQIVNENQLLDSYNSCVQFAKGMHANYPNSEDNVSINLVKQPFGPIQKQQDSLDSIPFFTNINNIDRKVIIQALNTYSIILATTLSYQQNERIADFLKSISFLADSVWFLFSINTLITKILDPNHIQQFADDEQAYLYNNYYNNLLGIFLCHLQILRNSQDLASISQNDQQFANLTQQLQSIYEQITLFAYQVQQFAEKDINYLVLLIKWLQQEYNHIKLIKIKTEMLLMKYKQCVTQNAPQLIKIHVKITNHYNLSHYFVLQSFFQQLYIFQSRLQQNTKLQFVIQDNFLSTDQFETILNENTQIPLIWYHFGLFLLQLGFETISTEKYKEYQQIQNISFQYINNILHFDFTKDKEEIKYEKLLNLKCKNQNNDEQFQKNYKETLKQVSMIFIFKQVFNSLEYSNSQDVVLPLLSVLPIIGVKSKSLVDYEETVTKFMNSPNEAINTKSNYFSIPFHYCRCQSIKDELKPMLKLLLHQSLAFKICHSVAIFLKNISYYQDQRCLHLTNFLLCEGSKTGKTSLILALFYYFIFTDNDFTPITVLLAEMAQEISQFDRSKQPLYFLFQQKRFEEIKQLNQLYLSSPCINYEHIDKSQQIELMSKLISNNLIDITKLNQVLQTYASKITQKCSYIYKLHKQIHKNFESKEFKLPEQLASSKTFILASDYYLINTKQDVDNQFLKTKIQVDRIISNQELEQLAQDVIHFNNVEYTFLQPAPYQEFDQNINILVMYDEICSRRNQKAQIENLYDTVLQSIEKLNSFDETQLESLKIRILKNVKEQLFEAQVNERLEKVFNDKENQNENNKLTKQFEKYCDETVKGNSQQHLYYSIIENLVAKCSVANLQLLCCVNVIFMKQKGVDSFKQMSLSQKLHNCNQLMQIYGYESIIHREMQTIIYLNRNSINVDLSFIILVSLTKSFRINNLSAHFNNLVINYEKLRNNTRIKQLYSGTSISIADFIQLRPEMRVVPNSRSFLVRQYYIHTVLINVPQPFWHQLSANYYLFGQDCINPPKKIDIAYNINNLILSLQGGQLSYMQQIQSQISPQLLIWNDEYKQIYMKQFEYVEISEKLQIIDKIVEKYFENYLVICSDVVQEGSKVSFNDDCIYVFFEQRLEQNPSKIFCYQAPSLMQIQALAQSNFTILAQTQQHLIEQFLINTQKSTISSQEIDKLCYLGTHHLKESQVFESLYLMLLIQLMRGDKTDNIQNAIFQIDQQSNTYLDKKSSITFKLSQVVNNQLLKDNKSINQTNDQLALCSLFKRKNTQTIVTVVQPVFSEFSKQATGVIAQIDRFTYFIDQQVNNTKLVADFYFDKHSDVDCVIVVVIIDKENMYHLILNNQDKLFKSPDYLITVHMKDEKLYQDENEYYSKFNLQDYQYQGEKRYIQQFFYEIGKHPKDELLAKARCHEEMHNLIQISGYCNYNQLYYKFINNTRISYETINEIKSTFFEKINNEIKDDITKSLTEDFETQNNEISKRFLISKKWQKYLETIKDQVLLAETKEQYLEDFEKLQIEFLTKLTSQLSFSFFKQANETILNLYDGQLTIQNECSIKEQYHVGYIKISGLKNFKEIQKFTLALFNENKKLLQVTLHYNSANFLENITILTADSSIVVQNYLYMLPIDSITYYQSFDKEKETYFQQLFKDDYLMFYQNNKQLPNGATIHDTSPIDLYYEDCQVIQKIFDNEQIIYKSYIQSISVLFERINYEQQNLNKYAVVAVLYKTKLKQQYFVFFPIYLWQKHDFYVALKDADEVLFFNIYPYDLSTTQIKAELQDRNEVQTKNLTDRQQQTETEVLEAANQQDQANKELEELKQTIAELKARISQLEEK